MPPQEPFRFLRSRANVEQLSRELRHVGLECLSVDADRTTWECEWLHDPLVIVWQLSWWPDGESQEDARILVTHAGAVRTEIDVQALLGQRHGRPLGDIIIERVAIACGAITGRHHRKPER